MDDQDQAQLEVRPQPDFQAMADGLREASAGFNKFATNAQRLGMDQFLTELREFRGEFKKEMADFKTEMKKEMTDFKTDIKKEMTDFKTDIKKEMTDFKTEVRTDIADLKTSISAR